MKIKELKSKIEEMNYILTPSVRMGTDGVIEIEAPSIMNGDWGYDTFKAPDGTVIKVWSDRFDGFMSQELCDIVNLLHEVFGELEWGGDAKI